ncbi:hypothetical protein C0J50_14194 [Silurus asotus]|uniref:Uncharacterized protein n=1 Tax=Silurus asotus TaxID=30991 RepID=A0AAD5FS73_SILAS|nr:hypothetical protein C0J50_14194 [Silurus asotus]
MMVKDALHLFSLIKANFLQSGTVLLPDFFSEYAELYGEARMVGVTGFIETLMELSDEQPQMVQAAGKEGNDVAFAYFNMSYEEMVYARECHAFLTGTILDSSRLNVKERTVRLVHHLWVGHMGVDNFVQEILTMIKVRPHKQLEKQEKLLQWVKVMIM